MSDTTYTSTRRELLGSAVGMAAAGLTAPYWLKGSHARADESKTPNDRPNVGLIGVGSRGTALAHQAARFGEIVAVCDVDRHHAERAEQQFGGSNRLHPM